MEDQVTAKTGNYAGKLVNSVLKIQLLLTGPLILYELYNFWLTINEL